ncbi:hypothetical protein [uncultured Sulfitobacter sp.]|uniref:hypothetical protein n=1 Tax=uncultured Sulfitobacter sp. TaxID=191468 RepID=UPI00260C2445|nr:hypothetical protein [uncultured Sulfitobacter sp.]
MAISKHALTGVPLNEITVKRKQLTRQEAVTVHIMAHEGHSYTDIVQQLGTNANRVGEVRRGEVHPDSAKIALNLLLAKRKGFGGARTNKRQSGHSRT